MFSVEICVLQMKKSVKKRVGKYGKSKTVHKSAKLVHLTFKFNGLTYLEAINICTAKLNFGSA
jgi:hypothetical protein